jgi:hypothetical protein
MQTMFGTLWSFIVTMGVIFLFVMWLWLLITIYSDVFRRKDIGGFGKFLWVVFLLLVPLLGAFFYIITQSGGMAERQAAQVAKAQEDLRSFVGYSAADELAKLDAMKADGRLSEAEYQTLRARVIG